jgi:UDP-N-acetylmuramate--alanine ligase
MTHVHFIGIGGSGLSAIARILLESGYTISGSDRQITPIMEQLERAGVRIMIGHHPNHVTGADLVIRSSAVGNDNEEVLAAQASGIPVLKRADIFQYLTEDRKVIAVAGTHGKTTTTAMLSWMLMSIGLDPSFIIGGVSQNLGTNAHSGKGEHFIVEADEYDRMFLGLRPKIAVVTNIEHDHPDCYPTPEDYYEAFVEFVKLIDAKGILVACTDNPGSTRLLQQAKIQGLKTVSYGFGSKSDESGPDYKAHNLFLNENGKNQYTLLKFNQALAEVLLQVPGDHNARNALATLVVADQLSLSIGDAARSLAEFRGTERRFDIRGEVGGITIIDDYAHHPSEIQATLSGARSYYGSRPIWAVWQPHTYSRTQLLFDEFVNAFNDADHVLVTEIYSAREKSPENFSARRIVDTMEHPDAHFISGVREATEYLLDRLRPGDVLLVLSAGDANQISANIVEFLSQNRRARHA